MNVLILTPDGVGSTLLQRLLTIQMQFHDFDRPVINLHELTNGVVKYWSSDFNREILGKKPDKWGYYQSLPEVVSLLESTDHYKVARLAQYHIRGRQDSIEHQLPFYQYLDENFFVISARRQNVFEHAVSMCINRITKKLNVYHSREKINTFFNLYVDPITIEPQVFVQSLINYKNYIEWSQKHFNIASIFNYDHDLDCIEQYILNLPIFAAQKKQSWQDTYGITFQEWNRCHFYGSNLGGVLEKSKETLLLSGPDNLEHKQDDYFPVSDLLPVDQQAFLDLHRENYHKIRDSIQHMQKLGILTTGVPIKKQTFKEKKHMVANFEQLIDMYNSWIVDHPDLGGSVTMDAIQAQIETECRRWFAPLIGNAAPINHMISASS